MFTNRKFGKSLRGHANIPHYSQMKTNKSIYVPETCDNLIGMPDNLGEMLNCQYGCCVISGIHHLRQIWIYKLTNRLVTDSDSCIVKDYEVFGNFLLGCPLSDRGCNMQSVLMNSLVKGFTTDNGQDIPLGYVEVDNRILQDIKETIFIAGGALIGLDMPVVWEGVPERGVWDVVDSPPAGGHCVALSGYDKDGFDLISWGARYRITNEAFLKYVDEAYILLDKNWFNLYSITPGGLSLDDLKAEMEKLKEVA